MVMRVAAGVNPIFIVEPLSEPDRLEAAKTKMLEWQRNGTLWGWLIDPYRVRSFTFTKPGREPGVTSSLSLSTGDRMEGFTLNLEEVV
jgi:Uma2 family endonuclease